MLGDQFGPTEPLGADRATWATEVGPTEPLGRLLSSVWTVVYKGKARGKGGRAILWQFITIDINL